MLPEYLKKKVDFVKELSDVYSKYQHNVERIDYVVFKTTADYDGKREFLIITYVGGGRTIKLCTGNSYSAIASEIANHLDNGYYDQVEFYKETQSFSKLQTAHLAQNQLSGIQSNWISK